jgi:hypothetical protein
MRHEDRDEMLDCYSERQYRLPVHGLTVRGVARSSGTGVQCAGSHRFLVVRLVTLEPADQHIEPARKLIYTPERLAAQDRVAKRANTANRPIGHISVE